MSRVFRKYTVPVATLAIAVACAAGAAVPFGGAMAGAASKPNARATALVKKNSAVPGPSSIKVAQLPKRPAKGITVAYIDCGGPPCSTEFAPGLAAAGAVLGWTVKTYNYDPTNPLSLQTAITSAVNDGVTAIVSTAGQPTVTAPGQKLAKSKGIIWINGFGTGNWQSTPTISAGLFYGTVEGTAVGTLMAAYLSQQASKGQKVNIALLRVKAFDAVFLSHIEALQAGLKSMCPSCTFTEITESATQEIGGQSPGVVVSYLQSHPTINYIAYESGLPSQGITGALATAGLASKVNVIGWAPTNSNIQDVKSGTQAMWVYESDAAAGWYFADAIALKLQHQSVAQVSKTVLPLQLITKQTLPAVVPSNYTLPTGAQLKSAFSNIWRIKK